MTGIEPASSVWKTEALPLSYIRARPSMRFQRGRGPSCHSAPRGHELASGTFSAVPAPVHHDESAVVVGLLHRVDQQLGATVEAALHEPLPQPRELVHAQRDVAL